MALIKCPECGGTISDKAVRCPHCGSDFEQTQCLTSPSLSANLPLNENSSLNENLPGTPVYYYQDTAASDDSNTVIKVVLAILMLVGGVMCVLPLFFDLYGYGRVASDFGYYLPVTQLTVAVGVFAGLLSVVLALVGIVNLCKRQATSWLFWVFSCVFACVAPIGIFNLICYNNNEYSRLASEKVIALKATYQCHLQDGYTLTFCPTDKGYCELKSPDGIVKFGHCSEPSFHFTSNEFVVKCSFVKDNLKDGFYDDIEDNPDIRFYVINATMTTIYEQGKDSAQFALKQISADVKTEAEYIAQVENVQKEIEAAREAAEQAKLEAFKNFRSNDLSAFMLHGRVKMVEEDGDVMFFDEKGTLTRYVDQFGNTEIEHNGDELIVHSEWMHGNKFITLCNGKISKFTDGSTYQGVSVDSYYSNYDANNNPTKRTDVYEDAGGVKYNFQTDDYECDFQTYEKVVTIKYSDYDEYGNFRKKTEKGEYGTFVTTRKITYYPMGK